MNMMVENLWNLSRVAEGCAAMMAVKSGRIAGLVLANPSAIEMIAGLTVVSAGAVQTGV